MTSSPGAIPQGDRRVVTVLFTDVTGFTTLSERLDPEDVREVVNSFFRVLTEPIYRHGGVVDKYIGDAIMATFGAPTAHEDDAERALAAAWAMQKAARSFSDRMHAQIGSELKIRIGLNTGLVVAGAVGGPHKQDYTVIGDAVNLAQRMEASARPGEVLVTHETFKLTAHRYTFSEGVPIQVKGRQEPVFAYVLHGPRKGADAVEDHLPLIGREKPLADLETILGRALKHSPQVVHLVGEAGMGKSRLCREFTRTLIEREVPRPISGRALPYAAEGGASLVRTLLADLLALQIDATASEIVERLTIDLPESEGTKEHARAELEALLSARPDSDAAPSAMSSRGPHQAPLPAPIPASVTGTHQAAFAWVNHVLIQQAKAGPLTVILEDLHWADADSLEWLRTFMAKLEDDPDLALLVVMQFRPSTDADFGETFGPPRSVIELEPLAITDGLELARAVLESSRPGTKPIPEATLEFLNRVIRRSGGNPAFLFEWLTNLIESGALASGREGWEVRGVSGEITLPATITGIISARLDRLDPDKRRLLQTASVVGRVFEPDLLARLTGLDVQPMLAELILEDFLEVLEGGAYGFSLAIVQEVAYQSLLLSVRRELHRQVADQLAASSANTPEVVQMLARHHLLAERPLETQ